MSRPQEFCTCGYPTSPPIAICTIEIQLLLGTGSPLRNNKAEKAGEAQSPHSILLTTGLSPRERKRRHSHHSHFPSTVLTGSCDLALPTCHRKTRVGRMRCIRGLSCMAVEHSTSHERGAPREQASLIAIVRTARTTTYFWPSNQARPSTCASPARVKCEPDARGS